VDPFINDLVEDYLYLVKIIANKYRKTSKGLDFQDLIQEGSIGLLNAIEHYDPSYGTKFSTYAGFWIKQAITYALTSRSRVLKLPSHIVYNRFKVYKFIEDFAKIHDFIPDANLIAKELGMNKHLIIQVLELQTDKCGLTELDHIDHNTEDTLEIVEQEDNFDFVIRGLKKLSPKEKLVIALKFNLMAKI